MPTDDQIKEIRDRINRIDEQLLDLISQRARFAAEIGTIKKKHRLQPYAANREKIILTRLEELNSGPLSNEDIHTVFREIIAACLSLEKPLRIAYLGPEATFTHQAALSQFGQSPQFIQIPTIDGIFGEVEKKRCDYGVVPIENSSEGSVYRTLDMFIETPLQICAEIALEISLFLLSAADKIEDIKEIHSHPQALAQCSRWLANNLPDVPIHAASSTAIAAQKASQNPAAAAIASKVAARIYNLNILKEKIEDYPHNFTRFWVIGHKSPDRSGFDKTSFMFSIKDEAGALYEVLRPFSKHSINMTKIESRPAKGKPWEYFFFADVEGHFSDPNLREALQDMQGMVNFIKVIGSYPRSV
ncbi:MAG: prephenate dehydratase [Deltaproteobacteria bacterium]|nr:prephenate dehydratase [Deltaproteobacteria bacterium]